MLGNTVEEKELGLAEVDGSIALAPRLAEAYAMRGMLRLWYRFDWVGARADLDRALALNPGDPTALGLYGSYLQGWRGQLREAAETMQKAIERDPLNPALLRNLGSVYLFSEDLVRARKAYDRETEIESGIKGEKPFGGDAWPIYLLILEGKPAQALEESKHRVGLEAWRLMGIALAQHALGHEQEARRALAQLGDPRFASSFSVQVAQVHAFLGEKDKAFEWLDRAYANRDPGLPRLKVDPLLRKLSGDPRYAALLEKINLPPD
jgi:tetratricopeptide (TPR) repeat protein